MLAFFFSITSLISTLVVVDIFCDRRCCERAYRDHWSMRRTSLLLQLWGLEIRILHWKSALLLPWVTHHKKEERRNITWVIFPHFFWDAFPSSFGLFWRAPHHYSRCGFGVEWASLDFLDLIDGLIFSLVFCRRRLLSFVCLGPSKQNLMLWTWVLAKSGHLQTLTL